MKKIILLLMLAIGFIGVGKAQFPTSSEIYYYVRTEINPDTNERAIYYIRFFNDCFKAQFTTHSLLLEFGFEYCDKKVKNISTDYLYSGDYDHVNSTERNVVYARRSIAGCTYYIFSKDRKEMVEKYVSYNNPQYNDQIYYKKVSRRELEAMCKPNLEFFE